MNNPTPLRAIREKCLDCCANQTNELKACPVLDCSLWIFRLGKLPFSVKNKSNPFLNRLNFEGKSRTLASDLIKEIKGLDK